MFKLAALNEQTSESTVGSHESCKGTKEAQEAYAFNLYNNALQLQSDERHDEAIDVYENLLKTALVTNAATTLVDENGEATERPLKDPGLILKYSTHKNMASMAADSGDANSAMKHYLQAVMLDPSDVTLWQRIGNLAISLGRLSLARHAFTCGLQCNENYWPCLDSTVTVLYALSDYETCMYWIAKALEKDFGYTKGLVFREKMICECPHLREDCQALFSHCSLMMYDVEINEEEAEQFINEALELREQHRIVCRPQPPKPCLLLPSLKKLSWLNLGECVLSTYELIMDSAEYRLTSPVRFGDVAALKENTCAEIIDVEKMDDDKLVERNTIAADSGKDELDQSFLGLSTEESMGFSEESQVELPLGGEECSMTSQENTLTFRENLVMSQWSATQQLTSSDSLDDDVVQSVLKRIVDVICAEDDDVQVVKETVDDLAAMVIQNCSSEMDVAKDVIREMVDKVVGASAKADKSSENTRSVTCQSNNDDDSDREKFKKVSKKKKSYFDTVIEEHRMRRSNRVKIVTKKKKLEKTEAPETEAVAFDYKKELKELFPPALLVEEVEPVTKQAPTNAESSTSSPVGLTLNHIYLGESDDVLAFILENEGEFIVYILRNYLRALAEKIHLSWEKGVREIVAKIFIKTQSHIILPYLSDVTDFKPIKRLVFDSLAGMECVVDALMKKNSNQSLSFPGIFEQFDFLMEAGSSYVSIFKPEEGEDFEDKSRTKTWKPFMLRLLWSRSKHHLYLNQYEDAVYDLEYCRDIFNTVITDAFTDEQTPGESPKNYVIELPNTDHHPVVSLNTIVARLKSLEQTQMFQNADQLYEEGRYDEVVKILKPTVTKIRSSKLSNSNHRAKQLRQLLLSYQKLSHHSELLGVVGCVVNEVLDALKLCEASKKSSSSTKRRGDSMKQWKSTLNTVLQVTDKSVQSCISFNEINLQDRAALSRSLCDVIDYLFLFLDVRNNMKNLVLAWTLLYRSFASVESDHEIVNDEKPPSSLVLLSTAHKWLGEKNLCCFSDGNLLNFFVSEVKRRFSKAEVAFKMECDYYVEQCFFCLYSYPNRPKTRRIVDHSAKQINLTWKDGVLLFEHFRPTFLPEFDSFKTSTITLELSQLLLKLLPSVPARVLNEIKTSESSLTEFIEGGCEDVTILEQSTDSNDLSLLSDMYYLLADYFFKNNEMTKAVKYYLLDIRINTTRFDAWAGLALAKSSQIDDRLRLCENKKSQHKVKDSGTERRGMAGLACFKRALSIDSYNTKLWIEYGSLAYWMHSMLSRKLKRTDEHLPETEARKVEMLRISRHSFEKVQECESDEAHDEEWLVQYMLGKISEKEGKALKEYVKHFQNAAYMLHRRNAKYPKKIQSKYGYVNDYAIEALEMHFRIHASILKYAAKNQLMIISEQLFIKDILEEMKHSPFVTRQELKSAASINQDADKASKLMVTSQSSDLTMGSLLPDNVLRSLNIEEAKQDENDTQSSACSLTQPSGEQSMDEADTREHPSKGFPQSPMEQDTKIAKDNEASSCAIVSEQCEETRSQVDIDAIVESCESAFRLCVRRFPHHIKAIYRLAHIYATCPSKKHPSWSRDLLYGSSSPWQQLRHMPAPGLLSDRNKTNLFNGVWRIPMDDIDRPGSFPAHLDRCLALLFDVLRHFDHHEALLHIHNLLHRTPEQGKKYLREEDRISLARLALVYCRGILSRKINLLGKQEHTVSSVKNWLCGSSQTPSTDSSDLTHPSSQQKVLGNMVDTNEASLNVLMEAYRVYQDTQKHNEATTKVDLQADADDKTHQRLLVEAYHKYTCLTRKDESASDKSMLLDEALRFCHQQNALRKASNTSSKPVAQSVTSSANHQANTAKPTATVSPQLRRDESSCDETTADKKEQSGNGRKETPVSKPSHGQITIVEDKGRKYTRIAPPPPAQLQRSFAPGGALDASSKQENRPFRLDPGLRHLQDSSKKQLLRSTSVPVTYPAGEENTPPHRRMLCRTGSCISDTTKLKLKNSILARTSAALVRKPSITDQEILQLRAGTGPDDSDSSDSDDDDTEEEERGNKRKYSDDATPPSTANQHPPLICAHQSAAVITTAEST